MNLYDQYADFTATTAIYPQHVAAEYLTLGLCSEAAESLDHVKKLHSNGARKVGELIGGEAGDICWYTARLAVTYGFTFSSLVHEATKSYEPVYHNAESALVELTVAAGLIAGKVKKQIRDGHEWTGEQREEARRYIAERLIDIVVSLIDLSAWLRDNGVDDYASFDRMLKANQAKLTSRQSRGTLSGSGDDR